MTREQKIRAQIEALLQELNTLEAQNKIENARQSVGKFFKAEYGETVSYRSILELTSEGVLLCFDFYKNSFGQWEIGERLESLFEARWKQITREEFLAVFRKAYGEIKMWFDLYEFEDEGAQ